MHRSPSLSHYFYGGKPATSNFALTFRSPSASCLYSLSLPCGPLSLLWTCGCCYEKIKPSSLTSSLPMRCSVEDGREDGREEEREEEREEGCHLWYKQHLSYFFLCSPSLLTCFLSSLPPGHTVLSVTHLRDSLSQSQNVSADGWMGIYQRCSENRMQAAAWLPFHPQYVSTSRKYQLHQLN